MCEESAHHLRIAAHDCLVKSGETGSGVYAAMLVLENIQGCLEVTFVTDGVGPAIIDGLSLSGDTLKGSLRLSTGTAKVSFQFSDKNVNGSIVEGRHEWSLEGQRTS